MKNKKKKESERFSNWIWEFSKKVVVLLTAAYFIKTGLENMLKIKRGKRQEEREGEDNDI